MLGMVKVQKNILSTYLPILCYVLFLCQISFQYRFHIASVNNTGWPEIQIKELILVYLPASPEPGERRT